MGRQATEQMIFLFNITRGSIEVSKYTYQKRARQVVILQMPDFAGSILEIESEHFDENVNKPNHLF